MPCSLPQLSLFHHPFQLTDVPFSLQAVLPAYIKLTPRGLLDPWANRPVAISLPKMISIST